MRPASIALLVKRRRQRKIRKDQSAGSLTRRAGLVFGLVAALAVCAALLASGWAYSSLTADLPSIELLPRLMEPAGGWLLQPDSAPIKVAAQASTTPPVSKRPRVAVWAQVCLQAQAWALWVKACERVWVRVV